MKVGILTFHSSCNFGANLQTLAMQSALRKLGVRPVVVDYREPKKHEIYRSITPEAQHAEHEGFLSRYIELSPLLTTEDQVRDYCCDNLDLLIVGSDAVFRLLPKYQLRRMWRLLLGRTSLTSGFSTHLPPYFADWPASRSEHLQIASVAASSEGTRFRALKRSLSAPLRRSFSRFNFVSVRDDWTGQMVRHFTGGGVQPEWCPDPVLVLRDAFAIPDHERPLQDLSRHVLVSGKMSLDWLNRLGQAAEKRGLKIANLPNPDNNFNFEGAHLRLDLPISPLRWFLMLGAAAGFVGIRFHALVSSLAGKRPAMALDRQARFDFNYDQRSKVADLCRRAGVPTRYSTVDEVQKLDPGVVLDRLQDPALQSRADAFADQAIVRFYEVLRKVLQGAETRMASRRSAKS